MTPFPLKIVTPDGLIFDGEAEELIVRSSTGDGADNDFLSGTIENQTVSGNDFQREACHAPSPPLNFATTSSMEPAYRKKDSGISSCLPSMISLKERMVSFRETYLPS